MSTEEQAVPFGNYQFEIYLKGLGGAQVDGELLTH